MTALHRITTALALAAIAVPISSATAAIRAPCQALALLVSEAQTDFDSLRQKRYPGAACAFRQSEFKCGWGFPGDQYGAAETEAERLTRCASEIPESSLQNEKRDEAAFAIPPDLSVVVKGPYIPSSGRWTVQLLIRSADTAD